MKENNVKTLDNTDSRGKKEALKSFFWSFSSKAITYFLFLVLGNLYLVSEYGKATFILAIYNIIILFSLIGLPQAIVPWIIKKKDYNSIFRVLFWVSIIFGVGAVLVTYLMIKIGGYNIELLKPMVLISFSLLVYWVNNVSASFAIAHKKYNRISFAGFLSIIVTLVLAVLLKNLQSFGIILAYVIGYSLGALSLVIGEREGFMGIWKNYSINLSSFKEYLLSGIIIAFVAVSFYFLSWADSTILGILSNLEAVGKYGISSGFAGIIALIPIALSMFVITRMSEVKNAKKSKDILKRTIRISFFSSIMIGTLLSAYMFVVLRLFLPKYTGIEIFVSILLIGAMFYSVYFLIYNYLIGKSRIQKNFWPILIASGINIILDFLLIPVLGLYGVCIATVLAHFSAFILLSRGILKTKEIFFMLCMVLLIPISYFLAWFGILVTLAAIVLEFKLKLIDKQDLRVILKEIKGFR